MSHFTVLVVGDDPDKQLAPYHEFECTGDDDEYIQDIDKTEDYRVDFEKHKDEDQTFESFCEDWAGIEFVDDISEVDTNGDHKFGYGIRKPELKVIQRTNQDAKWDWYQIGGRWTGFFLLKSKYKDGDPNISIGEPGLMTSMAKQGYADQCLKKHIDFEAMEKKSRVKAEKTWDQENELRTRVPTQNQKEMSEEDSKAYREKRNAAWQDILGDEKEYFFMFETKEGQTKEDYVKAQSVNATYAVVKDGQWYERGSMGWWGISTDEDDEWEVKFRELLDDVDDDTLLTVVDCHI